MGMEDETKELLLKIINTVSIVLIWMISNVYIGIYKGFAFFENKARLTNYIYYAGFLITLVALIIYLKRKWKL
ncbi:MAG: hypothetical protein KDC15_09865 [Chitinophagaceae bacterium]|nr:hypothetical protein [Chitinophagaceae bacterium]